MTRWFVLALLIGQLIASQVYASPICRHFYANTYQIQDVIVTWYLPIDFGFNEKEIIQVDNQSILLKVKPSKRYPDVPESLQNTRTLDFTHKNFVVKFMPGTYENGSHYFAAESLVPDHFLAHLALLKDPKLMEKFRMGLPIPVGKIDIEKLPSIGPTERLGNYMLDLYNSANLGAVENLVQYNLTWETYRSEATVRIKEVRIFMGLEKELDPRRKISFELWVPYISNGQMTKKTLGIMRVYDGSPFPSMTYNDFPTHHEALETDHRVPIERRYPDIDFRSDTEYIFEPGRLAKSPDLEGISLIEYQFQSLAHYLNKKFGFKGFTTNEFIKKGKILAEITGRNLEKFIRHRAKAGFGYTVDFIIIPKKDGGYEKIPIKPGTQFSEIKKILFDLDPTYLDKNGEIADTDIKFLLHSRIGEYIKNFAPNAEIKNLEDVFSPKN
jgi:hypothetical protein